MAKTEQHRQAHCCLMNERELYREGETAIDFSNLIGRQVLVKFIRQLDRQSVTWRAVPLVVV